MGYDYPEPAFQHYDPQHDAFPVFDNFQDYESWIQEMGFDYPTVGADNAYPVFSSVDDYHSWLQETQSNEEYDARPVVGADEDDDFPVFNSREDYESWVQEVQCDECADQLGIQLDDKPIVGDDPEQDGENPTNED